MFVNRNAFRSRKAEVRMQKKRIVASGLFALLVLMIGVGIWYGTRRPEVTIASIAVEGGVTVSHDAVRAKAEAALAGTYALLIPKHFSYLLPERDILEKVNSIPRVHNAALVRESRGEIRITFDEYMPHALWCTAFQTDPATETSCVFLSERGFAYAEAPMLTGGTFMRFAIEGRTPRVGEYVYDEAVFTRLLGLADALYARHEHRLRGITETKDGDLTLHLSGEIMVYMTKDTDAEDAFAKIESILSSPEYAGTPLESFEYIDLRFGNTVYVKRKGAGEEETETEPEVEVSLGAVHA